jgi:hypothetical protein
MITIRYFALLFLCTAPIAYGMEEELPLIQTWLDVQKLAGKVVVFTADSYYFSDGAHTYPINAHNLRAGYIEQALQKWREGQFGHGQEFGYHLQRLLREGSSHSNCALVTSKLKEDNLRMRAATLQERKRIVQALKDKDAEFRDGSFREALQKELEKEEESSCTIQ